jgi:diphthamide synthase (EF-2-diphthine--ammonia ligase)
VTHVAFGDLFLEDIRAYRESKLRGTGIDPLFPIWGRDTRELAGEMIAGGLRAVLTCVDPKQLDPSFVGREFHEIVAELPAKVDPCGERGEFHTFTYAGPMFSKPLSIAVGEKVLRDGFHFADVLPREQTATGL